MSLPMWLVLASIELRLPGSRSLKDKRRTVRSIADRLRRAGLSAAEVEGQGDSRHAVVGVAGCFATRAEAERALQRAQEEVDSHPEVGDATVSGAVQPWPDG